ncbi:MAG TPA: hypothetical protein VNV43_08850 [Candidatus Acidoferrales bacterium]|nr:hypothetical protein [Candidatus Acidoferrales bacterium]
MKNTIRVSSKNANKRASAQPEKPSIHGQNAATIGHEKFNIKGKVTFGALRVGEASGLSEIEIKALALLADWEGETPEEYSREAIRFIMQTSVDKAEEIMRKGGTERARFDAANLLGALPNIFERVQSSGLPSQPLAAISNIYERITDVESAALQAKAFMQLLFNSINYEDAEVFRRNHGHLAAGLQSLMGMVREDLESTIDNLRRPISALIPKE